ncbi:MAG: ferritin-like domain-containing protein [Desulfobacterium sp.]|nr:ferritin-like domain-containing protein [Desulfobacterium sp.]
MKWKSYQIKVRSLDPEAARTFLSGQPVDRVSILDVRQPVEYEAGHISGARLIPLPELMDRMGEVPRDRPVLVYCKSGIRSRAACQLFAGGSFPGEVINLSGGFDFWEGGAALGREDQGLALFSGRESATEILEVAYCLEQGLGEFYLSMADQVDNPEVQRLFSTLARMERLHQESILGEYGRLKGREVTPAVFEHRLAPGALEGGMTTQEYIDYYMPDWDDPRDVVSLAMSIEAQALDMYLRAAARVENALGRAALEKIAREEQTHMAHLGRLMETLSQ